MREVMVFSVQHAKINVEYLLQFCICLPTNVVLLTILVKLHSLMMHFDSWNIFSFQIFNRWKCLTPNIYGKSNCTSIKVQSSDQISNKDFRYSQLIEAPLGNGTFFMFMHFVTFSLTCVLNQHIFSLKIDKGKHNKTNTKIFCFFHSALDHSVPWFGEKNL